VEHFQVQFGLVLNSATGEMRYVNANDLSADDWESVSTARIWLVVRASEPEAGMVSQTYAVGDVTYDPKDRFRRNVLVGTINLRNM
jgi:hypothetical protein